MLDFILSIFSTIFQMNMRNHHDIPFAMPLLMAAITGYIIGFVILSWIMREHEERKVKELTLAPEDESHSNI